MSKKLKVGLDFGTSNSAIAVAEKDKVRVFEAKEGNLTQPSSIFIRIDGYISVGDQAMSDFRNPKMRKDAYHFIPSIKPGLPSKTYAGNLLVSKRAQTNTEPKKEFFPIEQLGGELIRDLKEKAEKATGKTTESIVLGRPVVFSEDEELDNMAQQRLEKAAKEAGFRQVQFVLEPVAAALYYERYHAGDKPKKIFVFDFGGGTLDTSVLETNPNRQITSPDNLNSMVLATHGIDLGGTDLDKDVFKKLLLPYFGSETTHGVKKLPMPSYLYYDITEWHLLEHLNKVDTFDYLQRVASDPLCSDKNAVNRMITLIKDQQVYEVLRSIEKAKIQVSTFGDGLIKHNHGNIKINHEINRSEFKEIIKYRAQEIEKCVQECLQKAQLNPDDIDVVLKVGGSSENHFVDKILREIFSGDIRSSNVFTSVVAGLAVAADSFFD